MKQSNAFAQNQIKASCDGGVGYLVIDSPSRKNAINAAMWRAIPDAIQWLQASAGARVILLQGGGEVDFSAGADISEFAALRKDAETARVYEASNSAAFAAVREASVPVIAAIRGICYGGGFGLAAAADLRIAADKSVFAVPAARLGIAYPADAVQDFVRGLGSAIARRALFTGASLTAHELFTCGFLSAVTDPAALDAETLIVARAIAANAPLSIRASKLAIRAVETEDLDLLREAEILGVSTFTSADYAEGRAAFAEKRQPTFTGK
ncbi:enoyl-CoA hydratase-related protein [Rhizobium sp. AAP43]|uniref:enoyl-CoA hydratase-related protein n=1 Tax=Rhizobium sp. AAP43 TaxID=1523420 RepID=UPI0006B94349|nr:enoyl-CoA hydratase-related protein [Rhizobium sp. AAP43]KPF44023.1 enoyl-CoA hydratase [Rhizobium sp. AAP43]